MPRMRIFCGAVLAAAGVVLLGAVSATADSPSSGTASPTTVSTTATTTTTSNPATPVPEAVSLDRGCVVGSIALVLPNHTPLLIGPAASAPETPEATSSALVYPADGSVVSATQIEAHTSGCGEGKAAVGRTRLGTLSIFGGAVTAAAVGLTLADTGSHHTETLQGFEVNGKAVLAPTGAKIAIAGWGYLQSGVLDRFRVPAAGSNSTAARVQAAGLTIHLVQAHAGLPAGTELLIAFAALPGPAMSASQVLRAESKTPATSTGFPPATPRPTHAGSKNKHRVGLQTHEPLTVTPPLGLPRYVFPVTGSSNYVDTYGAFRGDVPGDWHHGDDIFAPLGTPVVAVVDGTVGRVGWERIGGWRLWVRDKLGNRFYYAHLSGYVPAVMGAAHGGRVPVAAGEVIGFVGNSGDAFTTSPHLHFEIHPHQLTYLGYDGAVDPTRYLDGWRHVGHVEAPSPVHPPDPAGAPGQEARYIWRELLVARGRSHKAPSPRERPRVVLPAHDGAVPRHHSTVAAASAAATVMPRRAGGTPFLLILAVAVAAAGLLGFTAVGLRKPVRRTVSADVSAAVVVAGAPPPRAQANPVAPPVVRPPLAGRPAASAVRYEGRGVPVPVLAAGSIAAVSVGVIAVRRKRMRRR
jgi:murein DD-endopeptidase MepM/ murein hydrolase activator NlpD